MLPGSWSRIVTIAGGINLHLEGVEEEDGTKEEGASGSWSEEKLVLVYTQNIMRKDSSGS